MILNNDLLAKLGRGAYNTYRDYLIKYCGYKRETVPYFNCLTKEVQDAWKAAALNTFMYLAKINSRVEK